jgi:hypothetical protein
MSKRNKVKVKVAPVDDADAIRKKIEDRTGM